MTLYESIIEFGIVVLLIYTPLAFGGVTPRSIAFVEILSGTLMIVWLVKSILPRKSSHGHAHSHRQQRSEEGRLRKHPSHGQSLAFPLIGTIGAFFALIFLQLVPLPGFLVKIFSPATYRLYAEGAADTVSSFPTLLTLSVCPQATEMELFKFLAYAAVFFLIIATIRTSQQVNRLVYIIIIVGFLESFYGLLHFVSGQQTSSSWVHGTFVNKNHFAGYLEMVIPLTFGMLFTRFEKRNSSPLGITETFEEKYMKGFFALFILFIMICAHILSGSRGGIISFTFGMLFFVLFGYTRQLLRKWIVILLIFLPLTLGIIVAANPDLIVKRVSTLTELETDSSFRVRWELWRSALQIFQDYPLVGSGFGTFAHLSQRYRTFRWNLQFNYPENDYLQFLSETGIIGAFLVFGMGGLFFYRIITIWKQRHSRWAVAIVAGGLSAMVSIMIHSGTDFNLHIPSNALLFTVIAALSYVTVHTHRTEGGRTHPSPSQEGNFRAALRGSQKAENGSSEVQKFRSSEKQKLVIPAIVLVGLYLFRVANAYYAFVHYEAVNGVIAPQKIVPVDATQHAQVVSQLETAIRHDGDNAEYAYALGSYLARYYTDVQNSETMSRKNEGWREAEGWLQKAVRLDPANPWYYYELGLLSYSRGDCHDWNHAHPTEGWEKCPVTRYFWAALHTAPQQTFLREAVGRWYYAYDRATTVRLMREIMAGDKGNAPVGYGIATEFAKFLYTMRMDYESDLEAKRALPPEKEGAERCKVNVALQNQQEIELGADDGSAEWRTPLTSETVRIKKVICLPENLEAYQRAALEIYMSTNGNKNFTAQISIDDHDLKSSPPTVSGGRKWYEIPFDKSLLQGKASITVYIRVTGASETGGYLEIWGDQDPPNTQSTFNFNTKNDLSSDQGVQTGEYMIRLVLRKS